MASNSNQAQYWRIYFLLTVIESAGFLFALLNIPSEGISTARLILLGIPTLALLSSLLALSNTEKFSSLISPHHYPKLIPASALLAVIFTLSLFLLRYLNPVQLLAYYQRAAPILFFLLLFSIQSLILFTILQYGFHPQNLRQYKSHIPFLLSSFLFLLSTFYFISITKLGITPDPAYWGEPGVPIFFWQLTIIFFLSAFLAFYSSRIKLHKPLSIFYLPLTIYLLALILWLSIPIEIVKNGFYVSIEPPTNQPFPYSDSSYYDSMAHSLLIGHPFQGEIPTRPLYISLLAILHLIFGENYQNILAGQTFVLALIPVFLYFLGKRIHSPAAGLMAAFIAIFREYNSILLTSETRVSNSRSMLVDLPTWLLLLLACFLVFNWLKQKGWQSAALAGGAFGILLLLRTQSLLLLPVILVVVLLDVFFPDKEKLTDIRKSYKERLTAYFYLVLPFIVGFLLTISPWLLHNYLQSGKLALDASFQYKVIASQYAYTGNLDHESIDLEGKGVGQILLEFAIKDPKFVFGFISNHFLATQVDGLLALPLIKPYNGFFEPINIYWTSWNGFLEWHNAILLVFYFVFISLGLTSAWKRLRWAGLVPLAFNIGYALATAIGRFSGWRYDLPADWVVYFYFAIGVVELFNIFLILFRRGNMDNAKTEAALPIYTRKYLAGLLFFISLALLPWVLESISPPRYPDQTTASLTAELNKIPSVSTLISITDMQQFTSQPTAKLSKGRLLYPRFFSAENGYSSPKWPAYVIRDFSRTGFLLINQTLQNAVIPARQLDLPHGQDAIVLGCWVNNEYLDVRMIAFPALDKAYVSQPFNPICDP